MNFGKPEVIKAATKTKQVKLSVVKSGRILTTWVGVIMVTSALYTDKLLLQGY
ncbi:hypothetical protein [Siphonobacter sp. SORGH_AS_0500]|uniref:hypothetical protein n=1 Tax=Siphonobacter sp. SORGH_AS_0500 TaxID=1864824 RepID=UPI00286729A8|nr:hypothetical protein [Siphonobacter sp. SORGH_AS_0500]MDR6195955.1 hypothetical protein [Siphonobacter sp. SORGH_AS_0500]